MNITELRQEWAETDPKVKWVMVAVVVAGVVMVGARAAHNASAPASAPDAAAQKAPGPNDPAFHDRVLPNTPRNQGLEDLHKRLDQDAARIQALESELAKGDKPGAAGQAAKPATSPPSSPASLPPTDLNAALPPVSFDPPAPAPVAPLAQGHGRAHKPADAPSDFAQPGAGGADPTPGGLPAPAEVPQGPRMKVWADDATPAPAAPEPPRSGLVIPVNSALEGVMLSGINARPSGSVAGAVGSAVSANNVGAPFVTRLKGDALLPNGWKLSDLGDCFLGGSGVAILSTERAYVIADNLSCIGKNGEVYETPVKAYGLDVDGTLGVAGKVVSKQGALLLQAALTGVASGLGAALAPTTISAYNTNATNGSTAGVQYPNAGTVAYTAVGQGINQAAGQLSKFYLDYAREVFPVVEVDSGTRLTWVLKETIELHKRVEKVAAR